MPSMAITSADTRSRPRPKPRSSAGIFRRRALRKCRRRDHVRERRREMAGTDGQDRASSGRIEQCRRRSRLPPAPRADTTEGSPRADRAPCRPDAGRANPRNDSQNNRFPECPELRRRIRRRNPRPPNQRIKTDSALYSFVTHFVHPIALRAPGDAVFWDARKKSGRMAGRFSYSTPYAAIRSVGPAPSALWAKMIPSRARTRDGKRMTTPAGPAPKSRSTSFRNFYDRAVDGA